jgi:Amt family ammonium transporter
MAKWWVAVGYSLAFGEGNAWIGDVSRLFMAGMAEGWTRITRCSSSKRRTP